MVDTLNRQVEILHPWSKHVAKQRLASSISNSATPCSRSIGGDLLRVSVHMYSERGRAA
jgi:hypothetical protein